MSDEKLALYKLSDRQLIDSFNIDPTNKKLVEVIVERFTIYSKFMFPSWD